VHHFELLHEEIGKWSQPPHEPTLTAQLDLAKQRQNLIYNEPRPMPDECSLIVGDFLNNLRSTLDHLVCQAVIAEGGTPGKHHAFPIARSKSAWASAIAKRKPDRPPGPLDGITRGSPAFNLLRDAQPYIGRDKAAAEAAPISVLATLNNTDKHRELHASTITMGDRFSLKIKANHRFIDGYLPPVGTPLQPNAEFGWVRIVLTDVDQTDMDYEFPVEVAFDGVPLSFFREMFGDVRALIIKFENLWGV
jgi:hypothetical protein